MEKVAAIINSTSASDILPRKSERRIAGLSVLEHIAGRLRRVSQVDKICLATTDRDYDDTLCQHAKALGLHVYRGSTQDLIDRTARAAEQMGLPHIVKVLGNYPLIDPEMTAELIWNHLEGGYDFSYNEHSRGVPFGMGCMVISRQALESFRCRSDLSANQRESGVLCLLQNRTLFNTLQLDYEPPRPGYKLCVDTQEDLALLEALFHAITIPRIASVIEYLDANPIVARSNRVETIKEVGLDKLWLFPEKLRALQEVAPGRPDLSYPISVELSLTNRCNLNCSWCSDRDLKHRLGGDLDIAVFRRVVDDLQAGGTRGIVIEGGGEPLLHDELGPAVRYVQASGMNCGLITNGTKAIAPDILQALDWVRVSLDASNVEEFKQQKQSPLFETVLENMAAYACHCPVVGAGYVVTRHNTANLEPLVLRLRNMGVSYIQFRPVIDHPEMVPDIDLEYMKRYETFHRFNVIFDGMQENRFTGNKGLACKAHSLTTVITADGGVYLCGRLNKYKWLEPMGNVQNQSFKEIWNGRIRREQADRALDPVFCQVHCPECRLTKFNDLFARLDKITTRSFI